MEKSKLKLEEEKEKLTTLGQVSETKAKPWIQKEFDEEVKRQQLDWENDIEMLLKLSKGKLKHYFRYLAVIMVKFAKEEDIPKKYVIDISLTDRGLVLKIGGTKYQAAFAPSGLPAYDRHACKLMTVRLGNTIAKLEGYIRSSEGGILLPDEEHLKQYG